MKKVMLIGLALLLLGSGLFADDAKVMPGRVGRFYLAPVFAFVPGAFDSDGTYHSFGAHASVFNLGLALEFGVIDWITAAVQWAPGWTSSSNLQVLTAGALPFMPTNMNDVADLLVGAKIQIIGENAPVKAKAVRFALTPGVSIPLPGQDYEKEVEKIADNTAILMGAPGDLVGITVKNMDRHVLGVGGRVYFDWVISDKFFLNLYNETFIYPVKKDLANDGIDFAAIKGRIKQEAFLAAGAAGVAMVQPLLDDFTGEVNYKYKLTFEMEPVFTTPLSEGTSLTVGLPITYVFNPAAEYSFSGLAPLVAGAQMLDPTITENDFIGGFVGKASHSLSVKPYLSFFVTKGLLPIEVKAQYSIPVWGMDTQANHQLICQVKAYFKI